MQMIRVTSVVLLLALAMLGCGRGPAAQSVRALTNRQLESRVLAKLNSDADVRAANILADVDADKHQVTLSGALKSAALRKRAIDLAKAAQPGIMVIDQIQVAPEELARAEFSQQDASNEREKAKERGDRIGRSVDDAWIHMEIVSRLTSAEWGLEGRSIHADVLNGFVVLRGPIVNIFAKEDIARIASEVKGVRKVINNLKVIRS